MTGALVVVLVVAAVAAVTAGGWWLVRLRGGSGPERPRRSRETPAGGPGPPPDAPAPTSGPADVTVLRGPGHLDVDDERSPEKTGAGAAATPAGSGAGTDETPAPDDGNVVVPDQNLRFTVHRPGVAGPGRWYDLLVFMYESPHPSGRLAREVGPEERIERQVRRILGENAPPYVSATEDAAAAVPREGMLTFVVHLPGFQVNPPSQSMAWHEDLQRVGFRIRAGAGLEGRTARGRLTVFHGPLILAEMALVIPVGEGEEAPRSESLAPYRKIFASYAREDDVVVRRLGQFAESVGDRYLRDVTSLRSGQEWNPGLARLIEQADVFQLFWSWNAMESEWVRREWTHALDLGRPGFVRPVYWEDPMPRRPERGLPPPELSELHFHRLPVSLVGTPAEPEPSGVEAAESTVMRPPTEPRSAPDGDEPRGPSASTRIIRPADPGRPRPGMAPAPAGGVPASDDARPPRRRSRTRSWLPWGLPAAAVAILALGTSTLMMPGWPDGGPSAASDEAQEEAAADEPPEHREAPPDEAVSARTGLLVAEVTLEGRPLGGVTVRVETSDDRTFEATTAADGRASFRALPPGGVRLTVVGAPEATRLVGPPPELVLTPGDSARTTLQLERGGVAPSPPSPGAARAERNSLTPHRRSSNT